MPVMWKTGHSLIKDKMKEMQRADRRRDVRPHVLHRRLLRPRRRALRRGAAAAHRRRLRADRAASCSPTCRSSCRTPEIRVDVPRRASSSRSSSEAVQHFRSDARRHRRRRRARAVRRRLGTDPRVEHAADPRHALRGAHAERLAAIRGEMEGWLRAAGRHASDVTTRRVAHRARWPSRRARPARSAAASAGMYADYLWYDSLGARDVWRARVGTRSRAAARLVRSPRALFAFVNLYAVRQSVVSLVLPRRIAQHRDRRGGAGPLSADRRRRALARARRRRSRCPAIDWTTFALRAHRAAVRRDRSVLRRGPRLLRLLAAVRDARCTTGRCSCSLVVIGRGHPALRADAEPALGARRAVRVGVRATPLHDARRRPAARARVELPARHVSRCSHEGSGRRRFSVGRPPRDRAGDARCSRSSRSAPH